MCQMKGWITMNQVSFIEVEYSKEIFTVTIVASFLLIFLFQGSIGDFSLSDNVTFNLISAATISTFYLFDIETKDLM